MEKELKKKVETPVDLNAVLSTLPKEKRELIRSAIFAMVEERHFSGPLPPPEDFAKYEENLQGAANRILSMAEKQLDHRILSENKYLDHEINVGKIGQILGFILVICCIIVSLILGLQGHDELAKWIGVTTVTCVAVVFVLNKNPFAKSKDEE